MTKQEKIEMFAKVLSATGVTLKDSRWEANRPYTWQDACNLAESLLNKEEISDEEIQSIYAEVCGGETGT